VGGCAASKLTFTYTVELLRSLTCDQEMALMGAAVSGMFVVARETPHNGGSNVRESHLDACVARPPVLYVPAFFSDFARA
jgi:hypothetical protein